MKKYSVYSLLALGVVALSGCQDEEIVKPVNPAKTGEEITFGSSLYDVENSETRTIYGDLNEEGTAYPVYWEKGDLISIYCPQSNNTKLVSYSVTPQNEDKSKSAAVTKVDPDAPGLQWGAEETHYFSAFYPSGAIEGLDNGKIKASIPLDQSPTEWKEVSTGNGTTYTGVANTDYAFMWAFDSHNKSDGSDVALNFRPWVTILDVEIPGPEGNEAIKMAAIQLVSQKGDILNGEFTLNFKDVEDNPENENLYPTYDDAGTVSGSRSYITISLYDTKKKDYITLRNGDKIVVRFYLLPKDVNYDTSGEGRDDLQIRVTPVNSSVLTRTLNAQDGAPTAKGGILAHKVNKVKLPPVSKLGNNYWMSSIPENTYVTELSLPGSKMSYQTKDNGASIAYQTLSIADQFKNGIRAFQLQTVGYNPDKNILGNTEGGPDVMTLHMAVGGNATNTEFKTVVKEIADGLADAEQMLNSRDMEYHEYAFILLTYSGSGDNCVDGSSWGIPQRSTVAEAWMNAVENDLKEMAANSQYRIYTGEITPKTTINDVAGKIIIKVNYNDDTMASRLDVNAGIPAMFAIWGVGDQTDNNAGFTPTSAYAINNLRWGTSNHNAPSNMKWFYHEATSVGFEDDGGEETESVKLHNVEDMWERSIEYYKNNQDNSMWFLNDLGGSYCNGSGSRYAEGAESQNGVDDWTEKIGPYATDLLQNRDADATLGIVLMNYADPANQYSANLIQTIIDNNFKFILRSNGTASQQFNATYTNGGNAIGWD